MAYRNPIFPAGPIPPIAAVDTVHLRAATPDHAAIQPIVPRVSTVVDRYGRMNTVG